MLEVQAEPTTPAASAPEGGASAAEGDQKADDDPMKAMEESMAKDKK